MLTVALYSLGIGLFPADIQNKVSTPLMYAATQKVRCDCMPIGWDIPRSGVMATDFRLLVACVFLIGNPTHR